MRWHRSPPSANELSPDPQEFQNDDKVIAVDGVALIAHTTIGVPLSFSWRQSGTLLLPALAHALIDAYRNAVLF
jgi:hypothetical protein